MCGIGAIYLKPHLHDSREAREGIVDSSITQCLIQQNRGDASAGITTLRNISLNDIGERLPTYVQLGNVEEVFHLRDSNPRWRDDFVRTKAGIAALNQVRYSTVYDAEADIESLRAEAQPMKRAQSDQSKSFATIYNGTLANHPELRSYLVQTKNQTFSSVVDTETLVNLTALEVEGDISHRGAREADLFGVVGRLFSSLDGGYSVVNLFADGKMIAFRGPEGIRPLLFGENENIFAFASESPALEILGIKEWSPVPRGGAILIDKKGNLESRQIIPLEELPVETPCRLEPVYFARGDSFWYGRRVTDIRRELGAELAKGDPLLKRIAEEKVGSAGSFSNNFVIVPIPRTGIPIGEGYQAEVFRQTGVFVPILSTLEKRFFGRMFIRGAKERSRLKRIGTAFHGGVNGKEAITTDDSLIRGDTQEGMGARFVREGGAKAYHSRIADSQYKFPCWYGIDFPTRGELAVHKHCLSHIDDIGELEIGLAMKMGIASIRFQREEGLYKVLGRGPKNLCMACVNGEYPTPCGRKLCGKK